MHFICHLFPIFCCILLFEAYTIYQLDTPQHVLPQQCVSCFAMHVDSEVNALLFFISTYI
jgi:hypothetical protein